MLKITLPCKCLAGPVILCLGDEHLDGATQRHDLPFTKIKSNRFVGNGLGHVSCTVM